jgi:hypothetical protein
MFFNEMFYFDSEFEVASFLKVNLHTNEGRLLTMMVPGALESQTREIVGIEKLEICT